MQVHSLCSNFIYAPQKRPSRLRNPLCRIRNPLWQSRHLRPNRPPNRQGQKRSFGRQRAAPCGGLRRLPLCHRVVNAAGRLVPGWAAQADLLRDEGVELKDETHICLKRYQWDC